MDNKFSFILAFWYYKLILFFQRITGRGYKIYPGFMKFGLKICPSYLSRIGKPDKVICVMGTNGKTSVCNLVLDVLKKEGYRVFGNDECCLKIGLAHTFTKYVGINNNSKYEYGVVEVDELTSEEIFKYFTPDIVLCTNVCRDSLKKNGNPQYILNILKRAISKETKLILNADDVMLSFLKNDNTIFYGINNLSTDLDDCINIVNDCPICPKCHSRLSYKANRYNHIGKVYCRKCGLSNFDSDYTITEVNTDKKNITVNGEEYHLISDSIFNIYNELACITLLQYIGISVDVIKKNMKEVKIVDDRLTYEVVNNVRFTSIMAKGQNPVAVSNVLRYVRDDHSKKCVLMILDDREDNDHNSETISWLYDTDFEFLKDVSKICVGGKRGYDMLVRLLLAGIPKNKIIIESSEEDITKHVDNNVDALYFLYDMSRRKQAKLMKEDIRKRLVRK